MLPAPQSGDLPGHLADNVVHFARVLRAAGIPVGTDRVLLALQALQVAGIESREDFYATLFACLIDRAEHRVLFDQAFHIFWKDPDLLGQMLRLLLPTVDSKLGGTPPPPDNRRLAEALFKGAAMQPPERPAEERIELDVQLSWSAREQLRKADFESMSTAEWAAAKQLVAALQTFFERLPTRRFAPAYRGARIDLHRLLRDAARHGGDIAELPRRAQRLRPEPLVVIVDISGSMSRYSRMFLHFVHALASGARAADHRVHAFVFGTRLTHITRQLRARDPDVALAAIVGAVEDWSGGTRIATCLKEFNVKWARRVLAGNPTVLLMTDGLEHAELDELAAQMERLSKSCRRLVWLNPLLRYQAFEPKARGIRAMLPYVHRFLPVHNIESLEQLAHVLVKGQYAERAARLAA
ncbi:MAG TPA: VWA domain-containing protein [Burkholderiaceae bacterium]|nr:VWA domain-containing protein [Burkholderiaceae bacterium]